MTDTNQVALVVITYNSAPLLPAFFAALPDATEGVESYEVIVVDNASSDSTVGDVATLWPEATVVSTGRNAGYSAAFNEGVRRARAADAYFVLNPDVRLGPDSVGILLEALDLPDTGIAVPRLVDEEGHLALSLRREPTVSRAFGDALLGGGRSGRFEALGLVVQDRKVYEKPATADWASGAAMLISRQCLDTVGPWDESFFLYAEDVDYSLRTRDAGLLLRYVPQARAVHVGGESHESERLWPMVVVNNYRLFRRRHGAIRSAGYWAGLVTNEAIRGIMGRKPHRAGFKALMSKANWPPELQP